MTDNMCWNEKKKQKKWKWKKKKSKEIRMPLVKSDTKFEIKNENSIDKVNTGAIFSHVIYCLL